MWNYITLPFLNVKNNTQMARTCCTRVQTRCQLGTPWTVQTRIVCHSSNTPTCFVTMFTLWSIPLHLSRNQIIYLNLEVQYVIWARRMLTRNARKGCVYCTVQLVLPLGLYGSHIKMSASNCALIMLLGGFRHTLIFHLYRYKPIFCAVLLTKYTLKNKILVFSKNISVNSS